MIQRGEFHKIFDTFLRTLGLQRLEPLAHGLEIVPLPDAAHARSRDTEPAFT